MKLMKFETMEADILLNDGDFVDDLKVIYTPGHTEGSICLMTPGGVLFAGDAIRIDKHGEPRLSPRLMTLDEDQASKSISKIAELKFDVLLPGHGSPVLYDASSKVVKLLNSISGSNFIEDQN